MEVSMNPGNTYHVSFETIKKYLEKYDYRIFGIYEQTSKWLIQAPVLRRVNILFVAKTMWNRFK